VRWRGLASSKRFPREGAADLNPSPPLTSVSSALCYSCTSQALSEGLEDAFGSEELDAEADGEVNKVLDELLNEQFSGVASVPTSAPAAAAAEPNLEASEPAAVSATEEDEEIAALQSRLEGL